MQDHFVYALVTLGALMVPLAELPIFLGVMRGRSSRELRRAAMKVAAGSCVILIASALGGRLLLQIFGVSLPAFRVAGGLVLIVIGLEMLRGGQSGLMTDPRLEADPEDALWMPIVMPLIAGPAAITTVITLSLRERTISGSLPFATIGAVAAAALIVYAMLVMARPLERAITPRAARMSERFLGLILVAVGFQIGLAGMYDFFVTMGLRPDG